MMKWKIPFKITWTKIPELERQEGLTFVSDDKENENFATGIEQVYTKSQNTCLKIELRNVSSSYNQEPTTELKQQNE